MPYQNLKNPYGERLTKLQQNIVNKKAETKQSTRFQEIAQPEQKSFVQKAKDFLTQKRTPILESVLDKKPVEKPFGLEREVLKQLPSAISDTLKSFQVLKVQEGEINIPTTITDPRRRAAYKTQEEAKLTSKKLKDFAIEVGASFTGRALSVPGEVYAIFSKEFQMPNEIRIPFTEKTVPTLSGIYREMKDLGGSDILATLSLAGVVAGDVLLVSSVASSLKPQTKLPATKAQIEAGQRGNITELTYKDLQDITTGRITSGPKLDAYNTLSSEGISWNNLLKAQNKINHKTGKPYTIREAFVDGFGDKPGFIQPAEFKGLDIYKGATPQAESMAGVGIGAGISSGVPQMEGLIQEASKYKSAEELQKMKKEAEILKQKAQETQSGNDVRAWRNLQNEIESIETDIAKEIGIKRDIQQRKIDETLRQADTTIDKLSKEDFDFLTSESKKVDNLDDFIGKVRGSATQYGEYNPKLRKYVRPESVFVGDIKGLDPNTKITVYRGIDSKSINGKQIRKGDFVTTDYDDALQYTDSSSKVVSLQTRLKNLVAEYPDEIDITNPLNPVSYELIYNPSGKINKITKSKLTDIWKKAQGKTPLKSSTDNLIKEVKKYKTAEDYVKAQGELRYHQTFPENVSSIEKQGFRFDTRKSAVNDYLPVGVSTKSTPKEIGIFGKGKQLEVVIDKNSKVAQFNDRESLVKYLSDNSDEFNKAHAKIGVIDKKYNALHEELLNSNDITNLKENSSKLLNEWKIKVNKANQKAQEISTKFFKDKGVDVVQLNVDKGGFGKEIVDNTLVINPSKIKTKSQLISEWNKANKPKTVEDQLPEGFFNNFNTGNTEVVGGIKRIDPKTKLENINPEEVAFRINPKGESVPAVRQKSGIYAPKEFETFQFKDVGSKDLNFLNFAGSLDNLTANKGAGPMLRMAFEHNKLIADRSEFITLTSGNISKLLRDNGMLDKFGKPKNADGEMVGRILEGAKPSTATKEQLIVAKELRKIFDDLVSKANKGRELVGKDRIGYIKNYMPHIEKTSIWQDLLVKDGTTISDNLDFIIPNDIKSSYFKKRLGGMDNRERNVFKLLDDYIAAISNDIHLSPMIEQLKAVNSVLDGRGMQNASNFINRYIRENLVRKPATLDNYIGLKAGTPQKKLVGKLIQARNLGALAGNVIWTIATQPASLSLTYMETGNRLFSGALNYYTNKGLRDKISNLPVSRIKSKTGVGTTLGGDIDRMTGKIYQSKIDSWNDFIGTLGDIMEKQLTSISASAGYSKGKSMGLSGQDLDIYADYVAQVTQSMYNPEARPLALNSMITRLAIPFQTYAFEAWRHINTLLGKAKTIPKTKKQRAISVMNLITATFVVNYLHKKIRGKKLQTVGSFIPLVGGFIDEQIEKLTGEKYQSGRSPIAPMEDVTKINEAIVSAIDDGDLKKLRQQLIFWSLGLSGIGGAGQVNRTIDGIIATEKGFVDNSQGQLFDIKGWDKVFAPITGPYGTKAGMEFLKDGEQTGYESIDELRTKIQKMYDNGDFATDEIAANYILGEIKKREDRIERIILTYNEDDFKETIKTLISDGEISKERADKMVLKYIDKYTKENLKEDIDTNLKNIYQLAPDKETAISQIVKYAQAIGTDPIKAFDLLFKKEQVRMLNNGAIIVHRLPLKESEAIKKEMGVTSKIKDEYRLDHTIPLQLGGDNTEKNLRLVTTEDWASYTPVENFLGKKLRDGEIGGTKVLGVRVSGNSKMTLKEARKLLIDFKDGKITAQEIYDKF